MCLCVCVCVWGGGGNKKGGVYELLKTRNVYDCRPGTQLLLAQVSQGQHQLVPRVCRGWGVGGWRGRQGEGGGGWWWWWGGGDALQSYVESKEVCGGMGGWG
jgi:hypothetical protein